MSLATHRARGVAEIVDATFGFYRAHLATIVTIAILIVGPAAIIKTFVSASLRPIIDAVGNFILPVGQGAIAALVAGMIERSETLSVSDAFRRIGGKAGSLIVVQIASGLLVLIGMVLLIVPGFIAFAMTAVAVPVVVIEQLGASNAISRSRALARGQWGHILGTAFLSWGIALLLMFGAGIVGAMLGTNDRVVELVVELLLAFVFPIPAIAMTFLYYDLRVRNESADLDAMISVLPATTPAV